MQNTEEGVQVKVGDYVTALLTKKTFTKDYPEGLNEPRQGVFYKNHGDGTITLLGETGTYRCFGPKNVDVVPDQNLLPDTLKFVEDTRSALR